MKKYLSILLLCAMLLGLLSACGSPAKSIWIQNGFGARGACARRGIPSCSITFRRLTDD